MKKSLYLLLLILISSCTHQTKNSSNLSIKKNSVLADNKDSVVIDSTDGYRITKGDLREIAEHHPELITDFNPILLIINSMILISAAKLGRIVTIYCMLIY